MKKYLHAFTLAEVLITLGIIGVVAAFTLPALIQKNNNKVVETRLMKFYSTINQAVRFAEVDYGEPKNWEPAGSADVIKKYFLPYLPGSSFINESELAGYRVYVSSSDGNDSFTMNSGYASGLKLKTGETIHVPNGINENSGLLQIGVLIRENTKSKYISGKEYFTFFMDLSKGVVDVKPWAEKWGVSSCTDNRNLLLSQCKSSTGHSALCLMLIECNGWKIPDDYPIRF